MTGIRNNRHCSFVFGKSVSHLILSLFPSLHPFSLLPGDIVIDGLLFPGQQKMLTFVVYNDYGMPHYHTLTDETIHTTPSSKKEGTAQAQAYRVVLTKDLSRHREGGGNVVDVSGLPCGAVIIRLIYPKSSAVFKKSKPSVKVVPAQKKGTSKKEA